VFREFDFLRRVVAETPSGRECTPCCCENEAAGGDTICA